MLIFSNTVQFKAQWYTNAKRWGSFYPHSLFITGYNFRKTTAIIFLSGINLMETKIIPLEVGTEFLYVISIFSIFSGLTVSIIFNET
jgi:hypothetical protein